MCTCILAGRKATAYGTVLLAANDDWDGVAGALTHVPRRRHAPGEMYRLVGGREIPQCPETAGYSYTSCKYAIGNRDRAWAGGVNDRNVAIAGTGVSAFKPVPYGDAWLEPDDVLLLILERAGSAREGIRMIGELVDRYDFSPSTLDGCRSAACFAVADSREGWWLEMSAGRRWLAVRVPDGQVSVRVNAFGTHDADLTDGENVMYSPGLEEFAREQGWWDGDRRHFDFAAAYGAETSPNEWGPERDPMNMRRRWRAMCLLTGRESGEEEFLYSAAPGRPLTREDLIRVLRDVYQGTPYDLARAPGAGRWGDPFHDDPPSYSLCRSGTVASFVAQLRGEEPGVMWTCLSVPRMGVYVPLYADIRELPEFCQAAEPGDPGAPSLFWTFREVGFLTCRRFSRNIGLVEEEQERFERQADRDLQEADRALAALPAQERREFMTRFTRRQAERALELGRRLRRELEYRF